MKARFPGECVVCHAPFRRGEEIVDSGARGPRGGKKMAHPNCGAQKNPIPRRGGMAIPGDYPDWPYTQFGPDPQVANWTSYPQYSYEEFYRTNPEHPEVIALLKQKSQLEDELEGVPQFTDLWFELQGMHNMVDRRIAILRSGVKLNPSAASARPVYTKMPDNAGPYTPQTFPYGQGGRPATYTTAPKKKAKKNVGMKLPVRILWAHGRGKRGDLMGVPGTEEIVIQREKVVQRNKHYGWETLAQYKQRVKREVGRLRRSGARDILVLDAKGNELPGFAPTAKKNRGEVFLKPSTRSWPVGDRKHAKIALQYMTRGFGTKAEYPTLVRRLADIYPVEDSANRAIWTMYRKQLGAIEQNAGRKMPTMKELRARATRAAANPRRRSRSRQKTR